MKLSSLMRYLGTALFWLLWPAIWIYLYKSHRTRVLLICGDEFLALKGWLSPGDWDLPGGGLRRGETAVEGVIRETQEETGIRLAASQCKPLDTKGELPSRSYGFRFSYQVYVCQLDEKPELRLQRHEISQARWLPLAATSADHYTPILKDVLIRWHAQR